LLARQIEPDWVIIDERLARRVAFAMGLPVKGTLGILLAAVLAGLLSRQEALDDLQRLLARGIRIAPRWQQWFRTELGGESAEERGEIRPGDLPGISLMPEAPWGRTTYWRDAQMTPAARARAMSFTNSAWDVKDLALTPLSTSSLSESRVKSNDNVTGRAIVPAKEIASSNGFCG